MFAHATGFCKEVWRPVTELVAELASAGDLICYDQRGHGDSGDLPRPLNWWQLADDVKGVIDGASPVIGVGHSLGGAAMAMAEIAYPGTFRSLILIEPIIPPPPYKRQEDHPLAVGAERRRHRFADRSEAAASFHERGPFVGWHPDALGGYIDGGFREVESGGIELACRPSDEAEFYRTAYEHRAWSRMGEIMAPVEIIAGENSDTLNPRKLGTVAGRMRRATVTLVPDANHFVPMQRPEVIARAVAAAADGEWAS